MEEDGCLLDDTTIVPSTIAQKETPSVETSFKDLVLPMVT